MLGIFVQLLLVKRPAEFVQCHFKEGGARAQIHNAFIGILGIQVFPSGKKVFRTPELNFIDIARLGVLGCQLLHHDHGFFDPAQLRIGAGHLVKYLVVMGVHGILGQQFLIERYGLNQFGLIQAIDSPPMPLDVC